MAAGDLLTADFQAELRTTLMGNSTFGITAWSIPPPDIRSNDLPRLLGDGDFQGAQYKGPIYVALMLNITGTSAANLIANKDTLETAWAKATSDITFVVRLPQWGKRSIEGRPSQCDVPEITPSMRASLTIPGVRVQFKAGTPTWTQL
jgi:hypothetical protein